MKREEITWLDGVDADILETAEKVCILDAALLKHIGEICELLLRAVHIARVDVQNQNGHHADQNMQDAREVLRRTETRVGEQSI